MKQSASIHCMRVDIREGCNRDCADAIVGCITAQLAHSCSELESKESVTDGRPNEFPFPYWEDASQSEMDFTFLYQSFLSFPTSSLQATVSSRSKKL